MFLPLFIVFTTRKAAKTYNPVLNYLRMFLSPFVPLKSDIHPRGGLIAHVFGCFFKQEKQIMD